jgi:excisionase family DNA binding protein
MSEPVISTEGIPAALQFPNRTALNVREVAGKLGISVRHVTDLIDEGRIDAINVSGDARKHYRVPLDAFYKFVRRNSTAPAPKPTSLTSQSGAVNSPTRPGQVRR